LLLCCRIFFFTFADPRFVRLLQFERHARELMMRNRRQHLTNGEAALQGLGDAEPHAALQRAREGAIWLV